MPSRACLHEPLTRLLGACAIGVLLFGLGCDSGTSAPAPAAQRSAARESVVEAVSSPVTAALPKPGVATLELTGDRITLLANGVPARELLDRLNELLRFELEISRGIILPRSVTLRLEDEDVDEAFEEILAGLPYALFYGVDPDDQSRVLRRVLVGEPGGEGPEVAALSKREEIEQRRARNAAHRDKPAPSPEERAERYARAQETWYDDLDDPDPTARAYAVDAIYLDEKTFPILSDLLVNDPDPRVRAAAASTLSDDLHNPTAADALIAALADSNSEVVIEALDALEDVGDASNIADIQPLLLHPDSEVRAAAIDAIEWLEE